jgi:ribonuclease BN (tRNA processing enzyme)
MSQKITFFPLGNAESVLLELSNEKTMLMDFADTHTDESEDKRYDLSTALSDYESFDVVMFSHAHDDHVKGAKDFFEFDHAEKYKGNGRMKIKELWVSSAFVLDSDVCEDVRVIRQEARYRLKNGYGIKIFAQPDELDKWFEDNDLSTDDSENLIIHAGTLLDNDRHGLGTEFEVFVHAPFSEDSDEVDERNDPSIVLQLRLINGSRITRIFITGDTPHQILDKIVERSENGGNEDYLYWDIYDIPHHCSHTGLSNERGEKITNTSDTIKRFLSEYSNENAVMIASCRSFSDVGEGDKQPPHFQTRDAYKKYSGKDFIATMEYPNKKNPIPLVYEIDSFGITKKLSTLSPIITSPAPRAG